MLRYSEGVHLLMAALFLLATATTALATGNTAECTMTDTGGNSGLYKIEMHSTQLIQPYKEVGHWHHRQAPWPLALAPSPHRHTYHPECVRCP